MTTASRTALLTYGIAAASSLLFCSKSIFVKSAYAHGLDTITILALRMGFAFPFFLIGGLLASRGAPRLRVRDWLHLAGLAVIGYYLSSLINFHGLRYISVGLERITLYTYPSMVVLGGLIFLGRRISNRLALGLVLAYVGIIIAFFGEAHAAGTFRDTCLGVALVLGSALTYALFLTRAERVTRELGAIRFTAIVVGLSCLMILAHYATTRSPAELLHLPAAAYREGALLAIFGTVLPSYLMGLGIKRAGAARFAIIGTIGPIATIVLAYLFLGESISPAQAGGFLLSLLGGLLVAVEKR